MNESINDAVRGIFSALMFLWIVWRFDVVNKKLDELLKQKKSEEKKK